MSAYKDLSVEELKELKVELEQEFEDVKGRGLRLDMSRGKPSTEQLNLSMGMMDVLTSESNLVCEEGVDCRNYGVLDGIPEQEKDIRKKKQENTHKIQTEVTNNVSFLVH